MLDKLREEVNRRPALGWAIAGVLMLIMGGLLYFRLGSGGDPYAPERMTEEVTIKFTDTDDEITMPRGRMEQELRYRVGQLDAAHGIINPKTNQPTGFLFNKNEWDETVKRLNAEKEQAAQRSRTGTPSSATAAPAGKK